jgi:hypothetical protein
VSFVVALSFRLSRTAFTEQRHHPVAECGSTFDLLLTAIWWWQALTSLALRPKAVLPFERNEKILVYVNGKIVPRARAKISVFDRHFLPSAARPGALADSVVPACGVLSSLGFSLAV